MHYRRLLRDGALDCLPLHQPVFASPQHERDRVTLNVFFDRRQLKLKPWDCDVFITVQILDDLALDHAILFESMGFMTTDVIVKHSVCLPSHHLGYLLERLSLDAAQTVWDSVRE